MRALRRHIVCVAKVYLALIVLSTICTGILMIAQPAQDTVTSIVVWLPVDIVGDFNTSGEFTASVRLFGSGGGEPVWDQSPRYFIWIWHAGFFLIMLMLGPVVFDFIRPFWGKVLFALVLSGILLYGYGGLREDICLKYKLSIFHQPVVGQSKIWAYEDPQKKDTIVVEGEKGAAEPGTRVWVANVTLGDLLQQGRVDHQEWQAVTDVRADGSFQCELIGKKDNALEIHVSRPYKGALARDPHEVYTIFPVHWRLKGQMKGH